MPVSTNTSCLHACRPPCREKEGLKKPQVEDDLLQCSRADRRSRAVRGEHVAVYDLVNSRDHVRDSMEAMAAGVHGELQELLEKWV